MFLCPLVELRTLLILSFLVTNVLCALSSRTLRPFLNPGVNRARSVRPVVPRTLLRQQTRPAAIYSGVQETEANKEDALDILERVYLRYVPQAWESPEKGGRRPSAEDLLTSPYPYALDATFSSFKWAIPGTLFVSGSGYVRDEAIREFNDLFMEHDASGVCSALDSRIRRDGMVSIQQISVQELQRPKNHYMIVAITKDAHDPHAAYEPRYLRLNANGVVSFKDYLAAPQSLPLKSFKTIRDVLQPFMEDDGLSEVVLCGVYQVPRVVKALIYNRYSMADQTRIIVKLFQHTMWVLSDLHDYCDTPSSSSCYNRTDILHIVFQGKNRIGRITRKILSYVESHQEPSASHMNIIRAELIKYFEIMSTFVARMYRGYDLERVVVDFIANDEPKLRDIAEKVEHMLETNEE